MKRKMYLKTLSIALAAAVAFTSVPICAKATETETVSFDEELVTDEPIDSETETDIESDAETDDSETETLTTETEAEETDTTEEGDAEKTESTSADTTELEELDLDSMTDDEISDVVISYDGKTEVLAQWLAYMDYEQFTKLIARDTVLSRDSERYVYTLSFDEEGNETIKDMQTEVMPYYQIVLSDYGYKEPNADGTANKDRATFGKTSGKFYVTYQRLGTTTRTDTVNISGLSKKASLSNMQDVTVSVTAGGGNMPSGFTGTYGKAFSTTHGDSQSKLKTVIWLPYSYSSTYTCELTTANAVSNTDFYYGSPDPSAGACFVVNVAKNAGVTTSTSSTTSNASFVFNVKPALYTASYNGNGATSGSTASKSVYADQTFTHSTNGFSRQYTYSFNKGIAEEATLPSGGTVNYTFTGWDASPSALTANTTFKAQWKAATFTPGTPSATGYTFNSWTCDGANYSANQSITPTKNMTLTANWTAHQYTINFYDGFGTEEAHKMATAQSMTYGVEAAITNYTEIYAKELEDIKTKENERLKSVGLANKQWVKNVTFKGWATSSTGTDVYANEAVVKNLTAENNGIVNLYPVWEFTYEYQDNSAVPSTPSGSNSSTTINYNFFGYDLIQEGSSYYYMLDGVKHYVTIQNNGWMYEYIINQDGSVTISKGMATSMATNNLVIPSTMVINGKTYNITAIGNSAFEGNTTIQTLTIESGIKTIGDKAFKNCTNMTVAVIGKDVTTIGASAFEGCSKLATVKFMGSAVTSIGSSCFKNCTSLKNINLKKLTKLKKIPNYCFKGCTSLTSIVIPKAVTTIGKQAFYNCKKLAKVNFAGKKLKKVGAKAFKGHAKKLKFKIPGSVLESYKQKLNGKY